MIVKTEKETFVQKCLCGALSVHNYADVQVRDSFIYLPVCTTCNSSLEVLNLNDGEDDHSKMVTAIFAKVALQG